MLRNHLLLAWRNLVKRTGFSLINILGLSVGVAACILLFLYVRFETSFDAYNKDGDHIVRITTTLKTPESDVVLATSPVILANTLEREYPDIEAATFLTQENEVIRSSNTLFKEPRFYESNQHIFSVFTFAFVEGSPVGALTEPHSIVLTQSMARKYFPATPALGKTLICNGEPLRVTAVIADRAANSDVAVDALIFKDVSGITDFVGDDFGTFTFVRFRQRASARDFERRLRAFSDKYIQPEFNKINSENYHAVFQVEDLRDVHYSQGKLLDTPKGNHAFNTIFALLAVVILVIALLNYINLSTAKATERAREVGIRKVNGARRAQLVRQFLLESFLLVTMAWIIALGIVWIALPLFNRILETQLSPQWEGSVWWPVTMFLGTVLLAGLYPAFVLSAFRPSDVLKGSWRHSLKGIFLRKVITVTQFTMTTALVIGSVIMYVQMHYLAHKDRGFTTDRIIALHTPTGPENKTKDESFLQALKGQPYIEGICAGSGFGDVAIGTTFGNNNGKKEEFMGHYLFIDPDFLPLLHVHLKEGRNLSDAFATDKKEGFLVNEAMVRRMHWTHPVGQYLEGFDHKGKVIGVVSDFYYESLHNMIAPLILAYETQTIEEIDIRMRPEDLPKVKSVWSTFYPDLPFAYTFLSEDFRRQYDQDRITMNLFSAFTLLAILVSCLGLYGLISITVIYRTKEIGVRKILGASLQRLVTLLIRDSVGLIVLAYCIALPLAGLAMQHWLSSYAYHIAMTWWMFVLPIVVILGLALLVTGYQVVQAAKANPVKSLRAE